MPIHSRSHVVVHSLSRLCFLASGNHCRDIVTRLSGFSSRCLRKSKRCYSLSGVSIGTTSNLVSTRAPPPGAGGFDQQQTNGISGHSATLEKWLPLVLTAPPAPGHSLSLSSLLFPSLRFASLLFSSPLFFELCTVAGGSANSQFLDNIAFLHGNH